MKLCHVVPSLEERHGGPSKSVRSLCRGLARAGHAVELLSVSPNVPSTGLDERDADNVRVRIFRREAPHRLCMSSGLRDALAQIDADVIHHHALWLRTLHYAHHQAARTATPLVVSPRGMMTQWAWRHHPWRKRLSRVLVHPRALSATTGWHATSAEEQRDIASLGFEQPVCVAPNGVDEPSRNDAASAREFWHRECPETRSRRTALFYGRFHQKKRVIELIDLWVECAPKDWLLLLVGLPEDYTPAMLEDYARKMSASGRVRAFSGAGLPPPYPVASLFLLASHSENFGLTIAEAMAYGIPTLVTDSTPWAGLNTDARGWCVSWDGYRAALQRATAESPEALQGRGERARRWVLQEFSWDRAARLLGDFYGVLTNRAA